MNLQNLMNVRHEIGRMAEDRAAEYIASLGWEILGRNIRNKYGELDIVALENAKSRELVVIEVRCRTVGRVQSLIDSVGPNKLSRLMRSGQAMVDKLGWSGYWRIDIVGYTIPLKRSEPWKLEHIRDVTAFLF